MGAVANSYYFNASRWVWTGRSDLPITLNNIRMGDWQGITLTKVAKIATLFIFAFVYDLLRTPVAWCLSKRQVAVQGAAQFQMAVQGAGQLRQENTAFLNQCIPVGALLPIVLANLDAYTAAADFDQSPAMQQQANGYRDIDFDHVTGELLDRIQESPHPERLYAEIRGLDLRSRNLSDAQFLALLDRLKTEKTQLHRLCFPPGLQYQTVARALELLDLSQLRSMNFIGLHMTEEQFANLLPKLPELKELLSFPHFPFIGGFADATVARTIQRFQASLEHIEVWGGSEGFFVELLQCPQLKGISMHSVRQNAHPTADGAALQLARRGHLTSFHFYAGRFPFNLLEEICQHCPLEELNLGMYPKRFIPNHGLSQLFQRCQHLRSFQTELPLENADLRALAEHCPNLTSLSLAISFGQRDLLLELMPQWQNLRSFSLSRPHSMQNWDDVLVQTANASPSLTRVRFSVSEGGSQGHFSPHAIERFGALDRPLTLHVAWHGHPENRAQRDQLCRQFPRLHVVVNEGHFLRPFRAGQ